MIKSQQGDISIGLRRTHRLVQIYSGSLLVQHPRTIPPQLGFSSTDHPTRSSRHTQGLYSIMACLNRFDIIQCITYIPVPLMPTNQCRRDIIPRSPNAGCGCISTGRTAVLRTDSLVVYTSLCATKYSTAREEWLHALHTGRVIGLMNCRTRADFHFQAAGHTLCLSSALTSSDGDESR